MGAAIQSTDHNVLKAVKRSNISKSAYQKLINFGNSQKSDKTHTEIILALPGDTKEKHIESLRFGIDNKVKNLRMYQANLISNKNYLGSSVSSLLFSVVAFSSFFPSTIYYYFSSFLPTFFFQQFSFLLFF